MKYNKDTFEKELNHRFPNNHIRILEFNGTYKPIKYQCLDCGQIFTKTRANHLYENKSLCHKCFSTKDSKIRDWILDFIKNSSQFDFFEPWSGTTSVEMKLICNACKRAFKKSPSNIYNKQENTVCPYCGDNGFPVPLEDFLLRLSKAEREEYQILSYKGTNKTATFRHKCGFVFSRKPANFLKSKGCPKCSSAMSVGEKIIERFLIQNNIEYDYEKHFKELGRLSYDFYLPQKNILIEYQGEQHYEPCNIFGGEEKFKNQIKNDEIKKEFAQKNDIQLICIPYYHKNIIEKYLQPIIGSTTSLNDVASSEAKEKTLFSDNIV